jgi:soluble lytic murein transglycosylase-like protein
MSDRLYGRKKDFDTRIGFLQTLWYETHRAGLDTSLVLGLVQVESAFRKYAVSSVGARGYMQVMPFWSG